MLDFGLKFDRYRSKELGHVSSTVIGPLPTLTVINNNNQLSHLTTLSDSFL